jgi:tripartite-type tricarboxylate transporter receptor subunit TctC
MSKLISRLLAGMLGLSTIFAFGQTYPSKPISFFVAYAPGGPTDTFARYLGAVMSETLHQPFVVDNTPGAAGQIAGLVQQASRR